MDALQEELKGDFKDIIIALMTETSDYDAELFKKSLAVSSGDERHILTWYNGDEFSINFSFVYLCLCIYVTKS